MKRFYLLLFSFLLASFPATLLSANKSQEDTLAVVMKDGSVDLFPRALVKDFSVSGGRLSVTSTDDQVFDYALDDVSSYDQPQEVPLPTLTSFKFNNKFNYQVFTDVECEITDDDLISGTVPAIGHWLTPSFKVRDKDAQVFVDDTLLLRSKHSRVRLGSEHRLTVAAPGVRVLRSVLLPKPVQEREWTAEAVPLTVDMLTTNAPSDTPDTRGMDKLVDGDATTYFSSKENMDWWEFPYIDITLPEPLSTMSYAFDNRHDSGYRSVKDVRLWASTDGADWYEINRFSTKEGLLTTKGATNASPAIEVEKIMGQPCRFFRLMIIECNYNSTFCMAELRFFSLTEKEVEPLPDVYVCRLLPCGREYQLKLDWPTDYATDVPHVEINIENGASVANKTKYLNATISIDGAGVFPSMDETPVQIKGRGNSSWSYTARSKNPYRLKFDSKVKPFGLKGGKSWVLLANRQRGSMTTNAIGMFAAGIVGTEGANHIVPVELYMNGEYWGSYNFTEKVGFSNNSIDLDDESKACLLELDTYYDETYKFKSSPYSLPVNIKEPDLSDPTSTELTKQLITKRFNTLTAAVKRLDDISEIVDIETLARYFMVNELICNFELMHPKSTFLYHEDITDDSCKFKWGPVWDLDWAFGYENNKSYFLGDQTTDYWTKSMEGSVFMQRLRKCGEPLDRAIYKTWTLFMRDHLQELIDFCDDYYNYARPSLENNDNHAYYTDWDFTDYAETTADAKRWLRQRANAIYANLTPYELTDEELYGPTDTDENAIELVREEHSRPATRFDVYDLRGVRLKSGASYSTFRQGLAPGLYIVNGKKVLIP